MSSSSLRPQFRKRNNWRIAIVSSVALALIVFYVRGQPITLDIGTFYFGVGPWLPSLEHGGEFFERQEGAIADYSDGSCAEITSTHVAWFFWATRTVPPGCQSTKR